MTTNKNDNKIIRDAYKRTRNMSFKQWIDDMNIMHSKAYDLCLKHVCEAADIVLTPKQKAALLEKQKEICEMWDGIERVQVKETIIKDKLGK